MNHLDQNGQPVHENTSLIVEDLLLLLLDDKSGNILGEGTLMYPLGGAVLLELALAGHIEPDGSHTLLNGPRVRVVEADLPTDPLLRAAYEKVAEHPRGAQTLLIEIGAELRGQVLERLLEQGRIRRESTQVLGIFRSTKMPSGDPQLEDAVLETIRAVLVDGADADARTTVLAALLSASGTLPQFDPRIPWSSSVYRRGKELEAGHWATRAVDFAIARTNAAISAGSAIAVTSALPSRD